MKYYHPIIFLVFVHIVLLFLDAYYIPHLDSLMHLIGGVFLGLYVRGLLSLAVSKEWCPDPGKVITLVLIISSVATGAVCWEFYEWVSDAVFGTYLQPTVTDTVKDLFMGMMGATLYAMYVAATYPAYYLDDAPSNINVVEQTDP